MKRIRKACGLFVKETDSDRVAGVSQGVVYGDVHDEWGVSPHHFEIIPPPREELAKGGGLRQMRSMPFPSREGCATNNDSPPAVPSNRHPTASRHTRKDSKVAQILGIAGAPEKSRDHVQIVSNLDRLMSPPILPMEGDPFSGHPFGATIVGNSLPAAQVQITHPPAPQHVFRPKLSMPSLLGPTEPHATHTHLSQSTGSFNVDTAARRVPQPQHGAGYAEVGTLSTRSRSNQLAPLCVPNNHATTSQPLHPSRAVNLEGNSRYEPIFTHATYGVGTVAPFVRDAAITYNEHRQNRHHPAPAAAPNLRKARSSVVLSNTSLLPLHAPKPLRASERPSVEALHLLAESPSAKRSHSKGQNGVDAPSAVWPPAPVLRPLQAVMPSRVEREAYQVAAVEAEKMSRKINDERALVERVRHDGDREAHRQARDLEHHRPRHHRRAETEGSRRRRREVENSALADYPTVPERNGQVLHGGKR